MEEKEPDPIEDTIDYNGNDTSAGKPSTLIHRDTGLLSTGRHRTGVAMRPPISVCCGGHVGLGPAAGIFSLSALIGHWLVEGPHVRLWT